MLARDLSDFTKTIQCVLPMSGLVFDRVAFDWRSDRGVLAEQCRIPDWDRPVSVEDDIHTIKAVYVVSMDGADWSKIGIADNPVSRLSGIQTGNPIPLSLYSVVWMQGDDAREVEKKSHLSAVMKGFDLRGEWISAKPDLALDIVLSVAAGLDVIAWPASVAEHNREMHNQKRKLTYKDKQLAEKREKWRRLGYDD